MPRNDSNIQVTKFGGSTFACNEDYLRIAHYLKRRRKNSGAKLVVVVSAPGGLTEQLRTKQQAIAKLASTEAIDALLTLADAQGMALLRLAVESIGIKVTSLSGHQIGITTDSVFSGAQIRNFNPNPLLENLSRVDVVIVPGGQGVDEWQRPAWCGKNSSDLSAVAVSAALELPQCEIFSDVDGVYSSDPNLLVDTKLFTNIPYEMAINLSRSGAKVIHFRAVEQAQKAGVDIICRLNRDDFRIGTVIGQGSLKAAVVIDQHSTILQFTDSVALFAAQEVLNSIGLSMVKVTCSGQFILAVPCGVSDLHNYLASECIQSKVVQANIVSEFDDKGRVFRHIIDRDKAVRFAQDLHEKIHPRQEV